VNKRQQKKAKKKAFANIPKGYGIIIGNRLEGFTMKFHHLEIGSVVKVRSHKGEIINCSDETGLDQSVLPQHILINN
jgi:hypothetical protein